MKTRKQIPAIQLFMTMQDKVLELDALEVNTLYQHCTIHISEVGTLQEMRFEQCTFVSTPQLFISITHCVFDHCDLSNLEFERSSIFYTNFIQCKLLGSQWINCRLLQVDFDHCLLRYINFAHSKLENVRFLESNLEEAFMQQVELKDMEFKTCKITGIDLSQSRLAGVDLSTCDFDSIILSPEFVRGLCINSFQAQQIIAVFGITVLD